MKSMRLFNTLFFLLLFNIAYSQTDTLRIKTSAQCSMCKKKLEHDIAYEKGVKAVKLNVSDKQLTIVYDVNKTNPTKLRLAVSKSGYDADDIPADEKAYKKLQDCCKKDGHEGPH